MIEIKKHAGALALAALAVLASAEIVHLTGLNRGIASVFAVVVMVAALKLGWRAGLTAALASSLAVDWLFVGPGLLLEHPQHALIFMPFFVMAFLCSRDCAWIETQAYRPIPPQQDATEDDEVDDLSAALRGEREAERLLHSAEGRTYMLTARVGDMVRAGKWSSYEAGFMHALARQALTLPATNHSAENLEAKALVVASEPDIVDTTIGRQQVPVHVYSKH